MVPKDIQELVKNSIIKGIQATGNEIFYRSQDTVGCYVPVLTGELKSSGTVIYVRDGVKIEYTAAHAAIVERGLPEATPLTDPNTQRVYVPTHRRKNGVVVKGHYKHYGEGKNPNAKVITFRPKHSKFERGPEITRVITENAPREGQFFLKRAVLKEISNLPLFIWYAFVKTGRVKYGKKSYYRYTP